MNNMIATMLLIYCCHVKLSDAFVIKDKCPRRLCNCAVGDKTMVPRCTARNTSDLMEIGSADFTRLSLSLDFSLTKVNITRHMKTLSNLGKLVLLSRIDKDLLLDLIVVARDLDFLSLFGDCNDKVFVEEIYRRSNITFVEVRSGITCTYQRLRSGNVTCNSSCFPIGGLVNGVNNGVHCVCSWTRKTDPNGTLFWNASLINGTNTTWPNTAGKSQPYHNSFRFGIILGSVSLLALLLNFVILASMCRCKGQSVSKIFGISMMLFNVLLAEYGIALAVYLAQETSTWNKSFCQVMTAVKMFAMMAIIFALLCMTFQGSINPPDENYNKQDIRFKAIVYILEGVMLAGMICVLAWTKFDNWGYLCSIYRPAKVSEKIIVAFEYCFHCVLFLLAMRFPYKTFRRKEPARSYIKMRHVVEREHPVFVMVLALFLIWSVPFFVTISATGLGGPYLSPMIQNCALVFGAVILPFLFIVRNTRICCSRHTACGVNDPRVCQCKGRGSDMCYACEIQHKDMISNCEFHSFTDRRKSLSLDDFKVLLGAYQKHTHCHMKVKKKKLISRSFPVINMDTIEEADLEDVTDIDRFFVGNAKDIELSFETPDHQKAVLTRENTTSMPNLSSPVKSSAGSKRVLQAKLSLSPRKPSMSSPVKRSLLKKRAASFDNRLLDNVTDGSGGEGSSPSASDRSTTSSPTAKSDEEGKSLLSVKKTKGGEKKSSKRLKKKKAKRAKSKDSAKSSDSLKSKESPKKSKNRLEVEPVVNTDSGSPSPNRVSRIPSFIPLCDAGKTDDSPSEQNSPKKKSPPSSPAKSSKIAKEEDPGKSVPKRAKSKEEEETELLGLDEDELNRVPSRGPTFILVGEEDEFSNDEDEVVERPLLAKEKKSKRKAKRQRKIDDNEELTTPLHEVDGAPISRKSLEWDPSYSLSDSSSSSPVDDEFKPPQPAPPPSNYALEKVRQMGVSNPNSPHSSLGRGSSYSMDWDPTGVQIRHSLASPCEWEPYSVDEVRSTPTSPEVMMVQINTRVSADDSKNSDNTDGGKIAMAPLATADV
eukprot:gene15325-16902_t